MSQNKDLQCEIKVAFNLRRKLDDVFRIYTIDGKALGKVRQVDEVFDGFVVMKLDLDVKTLLLSIKKQNEV